MLKILSGAQVKMLDEQILAFQKITSHELMERAVTGFVDWYLIHGYSKDLRIGIFVGPGNNGGDGLGIARILFKKGYSVRVYLCFESYDELSPDCRKNLNLLPSEVHHSSFREFQREQVDVIFDSFLGVGLKGQPRESASDIISLINSFEGRKIAVDIPSGLCADESCDWECVKADHTVTFGFPKLGLLIPENASFTGELSLIDIGIDEESWKVFSSDYYYLVESDLPHFHKSFHRFSHKGDFGRILLISGSKGKMGASILSAKSSLRTGSGLVTCLVPEDERFAIHCNISEAMIAFDVHSLDLASFDSIGIGPGMGIEKVELLDLVLTSFDRPIVLDADALTILANHPDLQVKIPKGSILTPHLGEFERLFGKCENHSERLIRARDFCTDLQINMVIKGANSAICLSNGKVYFNSTGSVYMATAGMGDILTGMLTSFLGQGYSPEAAMVCGVYQHGLAGELAGEEKLRSTIASDLIEKIPHSFKKLGIR